MAGPATATPLPLPRNRPAPIAPPSPIMVSWRGLRPRTVLVEASGA